MITWRGPTENGTIIRNSGEKGKFGSKIEILAKN